MGGAATFVPSAVEVVAAGVDPAQCTRTALVIHGILGSGANWRSFIRRLVDTTPAARAIRWVLVDLRHHGESTRGPVAPPPPDTVAACAEDCRRLAASLGVRWDLVAGHSFGGKVALALAEGSDVRDLWLLDSPPGAQPARAFDAQDELARVIAALRAVGTLLPPRAEVGRRLEALGLSTGLAQWMTTNVRGDDASGYSWKFELAGIEPLIRDYLALDFWAAVEAPRPGLAVRVVYGGKSDRFGASERARLGELAPERVAVLPNAGHWLHADDPTGLLGVLAGWLAL